MSQVPQSLGSGVFLRQTKYPEMSGHVDSADIFAQFRQAKVHNFGLIDYFAQKGIMPPQMSRMGTMERVMVPGHEFTYSHPMAAKEFRLVEDLSRVDRPGIGGSKFKLKFNSRKFDNGWEITADVHLGVSLLITDDEILREGDFWVYTVQIKGENAHERFYPKELLAANTIFFQLGTHGGGEYSQTRPSIPEMGGGERTFMQHVGYDEARISYSVTRDAAMMRLPKTEFRSYDQYLEMMQIFEFMPGSLGYQLSMQSPEVKAQMDIVDIYRREYGVNANTRMEDDTFLNSWLPKVEMISLRTLQQSQETQGYWGTGGVFNSDGRTDVKSNLGLFHQYMLGNTSSYNIAYFTLEQLETMIVSRLHGRVDFDPSSLKQSVDIKTGKGGLSLIYSLTKHLPSQAGLMWSIDQILKGLGGNNRTLFFDAPHIASWTTDSGIRINIIYEPSLDPIEASELVNPMIPVNNATGGYRLSSYMFIVDDLSSNNTAADGSSNIAELYYGPDWDVRKSYTNGSLPYPGSENANGTWQKSLDFSGFRVDLEVKYKAYWLKDPTKSLVIMPINPKTGKTIYNYGT